MLFKYQNLFKPFQFSKLFKCLIYDIGDRQPVLLTLFVWSMRTEHKKCKQNLYIKHLNSLENRKGLNKFWYLNNIVLASLQSLMNKYSRKLSYKSFKSMKVPEIHTCSLVLLWAPRIIFDPHPIGNICYKICELILIYCFFHLSKSLIATLGKGLYILSW